MEVVYRCCCGIDVHKKMIVACLDKGGKRELQEFGTTTSAIKELANWLTESGCEMIAMESTGVFWKPLYNFFELMDLDAIIVTASHMKALPGRKTDVKDAEWIADLLRHGLLKASYIPSREQRELRELTRYCKSLIEERRREMNRLQKILEGADIKLDSVVKDINGKSSRKLLEKIIANEMPSSDSRMRPKPNQLMEAIDGITTPLQQRLLAQIIDHIDDLNRRGAVLDEMVKFIVTSENAAKSFDAAKKPLNLIALFIQLLIIASRMFAIAFGWNYRYIARFHCQSPCLIPLVGPVHQKINGTVNWAKPLQKSTTFRCIAAVSCGQCRHYPISIRCGDHMKFGVPSAEVVRVVEDCRDKKGKIDEKKAYIKLIDTFTSSQYTAKRLYGYHLEEGKDVSSEIAALQAKVDAARKAQTLNDDFQVVQNGEVVLETRKLTKEEIDLSVRRVSRIVKIGMFMDRYPAELSGGQQQRVAVARTLAPELSVLFMDEPLSNLDAKLRLEMRYELQRLHVETGSTFVYVTHDQMEAMTLATQICLINSGVLQQYDAPLTVYNRPNNLFVADFVGNPSINFIEGRGKQHSNGGVELSLLGDKKAVFRPAEPLDLPAAHR